MLFKQVEAVAEHMASSTWGMRRKMKLSPWSQIGFQLVTHQSEAEYLTTLYKLANMPTENLSQ